MQSIDHKDNTFIVITKDFLQIFVLTEVSRFRLYPYCHTIFLSLDSVSL